MPLVDRNGDTISADQGMSVGPAAIHDGEAHVPSRSSS